MCNVTVVRAGDICPRNARQTVQCSLEEAAVEEEHVEDPAKRPRKRRKSQRPKWPISDERLPDRVLIRSYCTAATGAESCPSARAARAGKLTAPHHGQLSLLGAKSGCLGRHEPTAQQGGVKQKYNRQNQIEKS